MKLVFLHGALPTMAIQVGNHGRSVLEAGGQLKPTDVVFFCRTTWIEPLCVIPLSTALAGAHPRVISSCLRSSYAAFLSLATVAMRVSQVSLGHA